MPANTINTPRLRLILESLDETRQRIAALAPADRAEVSPHWLAMVEALAEASPWVLGFRMVRKEDGAVVGHCGFKGPPTVEGVVEIAYSVETDQRGNGYATEAARAMMRFAYECDEVRLVIAHTLPETNASTRVLQRSGFAFAGEVIDPEDGRVWRWEAART